MAVGSVATHTMLSTWTFPFSIFVFTSLAITKRLAELRGSVTSDGPLPRRAYSQVDLPLIGGLGAASGYVAVLVLALYVNSSEVVTLYRKPQILYLLCPVLAYWISRILIIANRGAMDDDPIVFAFRDPASYFAALAALVIIAAAV